MICVFERRRCQWMPDLKLLPALSPRVTASARWGVALDQEGFFRSGPAQGSDGVLTGLKLAMIGSGGGGGFLAFFPMACFPVASGIGCYLGLRIVGWPS